MPILNLIALESISKFIATNELNNGSERCSLKQ